MKPIVDPIRLVRPEDRLGERFPGLEFREVHSFRTSGESILLTDPGYLADVYRSEDEEASFVRMCGVIVMDFGGDVSCPVRWQHPFVLLPISMHLSGKDLAPPEGVTVLAAEAGCDSGSFVFLPLTKDMPAELVEEVERVVKEDNGAVLALPAGEWNVFYQQWDAPQERSMALYRNIVLRWEARTSLAG